MSRVWRLRAFAALTGALLGSPMHGVAAQAPAPPVTTIPDPAAPRRSPLNYFVRSLLVPGWGQASLDRKLTGGLFLAFEGVALGMALKTDHELAYLERTESERVDEKRQERQDWFVLLGMNHLFSGLEAFVSANLFDFPGDLTVRPLPGGRTGYGLRLPVPR
jgi:hypothetical protein